MIVQALNAQKKLSLIDYLIDPITLDQPQLFLVQNQQYHQDMDSTLGVQASDLEDVDFEDDHQLQAWIYLHWQEHVTAETILGIAS